MWSFSRRLVNPLWVYLLGFYTTYAIYFQVWWNHVSFRDLSTSVKAVCAWRMPNTLEISLFTIYKLLYSYFAISLIIFYKAVGISLGSYYSGIHTAYAIYWYQVTWLTIIIKNHSMVGLFISYYMLSLFSYVLHLLGASRCTWLYFSALHSLLIWKKYSGDHGEDDWSTRLWSNLVREKIIFPTVKVSGATVEIMGTPYPHGMVIRLVIGDNIYVWNM